MNEILDDIEEVNFKRKYSILSFIFSIINLSSTTYIYFVTSNQDEEAPRYIGLDAIIALIIFITSFLLCTKYTWLAYSQKNNLTNLSYLE